MERGGDDILEPSDALETARKRRMALRDALAALEFAVASPAATGAVWWSRVSDELHILRHAVRDHIETVESPGGLMAEVLDRAPHLRPATDELRAEHGEIAEAVDQALDLVSRQSVEPRPDRTEEARSMVIALFARIAAHRQRGADLVYEAYEVDIGRG